MNSSSRFRLRKRPFYALLTASAIAGLAVAGCGNVDEGDVGQANLERAQETRKTEVKGFPPELVEAITHVENVGRFTCTYERELLGPVVQCPGAVNFRAADSSKDARATARAYRKIKQTYPGFLRFGTSGKLIYWVQGGIETDAKTGRQQLKPLELSSRFYWLQVEAAMSTFRD